MTTPNFTIFLLKTITMHIINIQQFIETKSMMKMIETSIEDLMTMLKEEINSIINTCYNNVSCDFSPQIYFY